MSESSKARPLWKKLLIFGFGLAFLGTMTLPMLSAFRGGDSAANRPNPTNPQSTLSADQIEEIESGYEKVLEREPNNVTALQGLAESRLKRGDLRGGLVPLKKLAAQFPEEKELAKLVTAIEAQLQSGGAPNAPSPK
jgi:hypothetical protein